MIIITNNIKFNFLSCAYKKNQVPFVTFIEKYFKVSKPNK